MANSLIPIQMPLLGLNTVNPFIDFDSGFARELTNFSIVNGRLKMRPAVRSTMDNASLAQAITWFDEPTAGNWYAILADGKIRKLNDGSGAATIGGAAALNVTRVKHVSLDLIFGAREPRIAANPFTAWTFTTLGIGATTIRCGASHKGRLYVADGNTLEYSTVAAITGTMAGSFSLADQLDGQVIVRIFSVSIHPGVIAENVLVIFGHLGRVLVYQGDYPASATWSIIGKYDMPRPGSNVSFVEIDGDIFVSTYSYAYWFKDLFQGGAQPAYANSPTLPIENIWQSAGWQGVDTLYNQGCYYDPSLDAIVQILYQPAIDGGVAGIVNGFSRFVYFRKYKAWAIWTVPPLFFPVRTDLDYVYGFPTIYGCSWARSEIVTMTAGIAQDTASGGTPSTYNIEATWKTPYGNPFEGRSMKVNGVRPFWQNSISGYMDKMRVIFDYSDFNSPYGFYTQTTATQVNPGNYSDGQLDLTAQAWNQYNGFLGIGGEGGAASYQFSMKMKTGSSTTQTQEIYAAHAYAESGGIFI